MLSPIVIPGYLALAYVTALTLAALALVAWAVESHLSKPAGRHRSPAAIAEADAIAETLTGEIVTGADIDPAPELEAPKPAPCDPLDPAMSLADIEALMESIIADAARIEPMPQRIPGAALAASMADNDTHELAEVK